VTHPHPPRRAGGRAAALAVAGVTAAVALGCQLLLPGLLGPAVSAEPGQAIAAPVAFRQETSTTGQGTGATSTSDPSATTAPGETSTSGAGATAPGGQQAAGIEVEPRVVDLVFRTGRVRGGKDTATVSEAPGSTEVDLSADVLFAFNSDRLSPAAQAELEETAKLIRERSKGPVRIEGHTDSVGSPSYNLGLSRRRAEAVRAALERLLTGRATQFSVQGFGASRPIAPNRNPDGSDNPKGRQKNRRVTVAMNT
jgi:outer membrane protein OmpA-like peptidoglycan-associated protein